MNHIFRFVMSDVRSAKWEADLHGAGFWIQSCGGHFKVVKHTGLRIWMLDLSYDKYCEPFDISRLTLYYMLVWLKLSTVVACKHKAR